jgi:ketosteroid isomerase-like protein
MKVKAAPDPVVVLFNEGFECWNGGEVDLMQDMYAEDAEVDPSALFTDLAPIRGRDQVRRYFDEMWETWEGLRLEPLEVFDAGENRFLVDVRLWGKGKRSGAEVDQRFAFLYTFGGDGLIARNQFFPDKESALAALESGQIKET